MAQMAQINNNKIFRFKLDETVMERITYFAKVHQHDDRHSYKDAWLVWLKANNELVEREISRLQQLGYKGDVIDKMFKAGRYYFREKAAAEPVVAKNDVAKKKRDYIVMSSEVIEVMDTHLRKIMKSPDFKPAQGYIDFCSNHMDVLRREIIRLIQNKKGPLDSAEKIADKIKKTYKNRYFMLTKQN